MTMVAAAPWEPQPLGRAALLWGGAALVAILAHGGAAWYALHRPATLDMAASPPPAVMIELAPETVAPQADLMELAPDEVDQHEVVAPETLQPPDDPAMAEDRLTPATDIAPVTPPPDLAPAPVPPTVVPEVVLPPPERPVEEPPPPVKAEKKAAKPKPPAPQKERQAAKSDAAAPAPKAAARDSGTGAAGKAVMASWQQRVSAHLERRKRYPSAARSRREEGVVQVRFKFDAGGNILSSQLVRSSGHAALDAEAVALMSRASPIPAPPPDAATRTLTVPIRFNVR